MLRLGPGRRPREIRERGLRLMLVPRLRLR